MGSVIGAFVAALSGLSFGPAFLPGVATPGYVVVAPLGLVLASY
jgi:hypothetical protein